MEEEINKDYQKGFNEGYIITAYEPGLSDQLAKIDSGAPRLEGLRDGRKQFALDQVREHWPSWMTQSKDASPPTPDNEKDYDIGR